MSDVVSTNPAAASSGTKKPRTVWTDELLFAEAAKYTARGAFQRGSRRAYSAARRRGILDRICAHMGGRKAPLKWTDEMLAAEALKYTTRGAFQRGSKRAYSAALRRGILDRICAHTSALYEPLTEEMVAAEAAKYPSRRAFSIGSGRAYRAALRKGILNRVCEHMGPYKERTNWTDEMLAAEAAKYSSRKAFVSGSPGAYSAALRRDIIDRICAHMDVTFVSWDEDMLRAEAAKYATRGEFSLGSRKAYSVARRRGLLDHICGHMQKLRVNWDEDMLRAEAAKYSTRREFSDGSKSAYERARLGGILDSICAHMVPGEGGSDNDTIYIWRANGVQHLGLNVYKIGITSARLGDKRIASCAYDSGFQPTIVCIAKVTESARFLESEFLKLGLDPGFTGFGGCTEFRALTPEEVDSILCIIDLYADEPLAEESIEQPVERIAA